MRLAAPFRRSVDRRCRRAVVLVSLLGYLAAIVGYPMPARVRKSADRPFPCQHHACGCVDADQCWRGCCCYTPAEKLAWARANHVTPPVDAEQVTGPAQLAENEHHDDHDHLAAHGIQDAHEHLADGDQHLAGRSPRRCCTLHTKPADGRADDDQSLAKRAGQSPATSESDDDASAVRFVSGDAWRKCRGLPTLWVTTGAAIPPPAVVCWQFSWDVVEWLSTSTPADCGGILAPPVPPPRV